MRASSLALIALALLYCRDSFAFDQNGLSEPVGGSAAVDKEALAIAQKHYNDGKVLFNKRKFKEAMIEFRAAYEYIKSPDLLHNLSMCFEYLGDVAQAIDYEDQFFKQKGTELTPRERDETQGRLYRLRQQANPTPTPTPTATVISPTPPANTTTPEPRFKPSPLALSLMAVGAGVLVIGGGCSIGALLTSQKISQGGTYSSSDYDSLFSRGQTLDRVGIAGEVIGGVTAAVGLTLTLVEYRRSKRSKAYSTEHHP
jgi:tetratricopeptide (TPR) repeat protein